LLFALCSSDLPLDDRLVSGLQPRARLDRDQLRLRGTDRAPGFDALPRTGGIELRYARDTAPARKLIQIKFRKNSLASRHGGIE
jgi:hypothetical protein